MIKIRYKFLDYERKNFDAKKKTTMSILFIYQTYCLSVYFTNKANYARLPSQYFNAL